MLVAVGAVAIVWGLVLRVWVAVGPLGVLNADEVVSLLMARDLLDGDVSTFFWNQSYGGTVQLFPLAALMAVVGEDASAIVLPLCEWALIAALTFVAARRRLDAAAALAVTGLAAVAPAAAIWMSTRPMLFYNATVIFGLAAIILADRPIGGNPAEPPEMSQDRDAQRALPTIFRDRRVRWAALGVVLGLGWWTSTQILYFAVPALYAVIRHRRLRSWTDAALLAGGAIIGAAPWLVDNVRTGGNSLTEGPPRDGSIADHVSAQIERGWPMIVGLRRPFDERWLVPGPGWLLVALVAVGAVALTVAFARVEAIRTPLAGVLPAFFVLHLLAPTGSFVGNGRYYLFVVPSLAYAVVAAMTTLGSTASVRRRAVATGAIIATIVIAAIASIATLDSMRDVQFGPEDPEAVLAALDERGIDHLYTNYWVGYPLAWADEDLVVSPNFTERRPDWSAAVRAADRVAYVFWLPQSDDAARADDLIPRLEAVGIEERFDVGGYRVVIPSRNVAPELLPAG